jgi:hypothetical protein
MAVAARVARSSNDFHRDGTRPITVRLAEARRDRVPSDTTCRRRSRKYRANERARSKRRERGRSQEKNIFVFD